eukprot:6719775-Lingulodinium_polyedra.AAC.1
MPPRLALRMRKGASRLHNVVAGTTMASVFSTMIVLTFSLAKAMADWGISNRGPSVGRAYTTFLK